MSDDGFEATFVIRVSAAEAWEHLVAADAGRELEEEQVWLPGFQDVAEVVEVDRGRSLRARKLNQPCAGTEIVVTIEDEERGARITVSQHGFGPGFGALRPWLATGWPAIVTDLAIVLERGVDPGRHLGRWAALGGDVTETPLGLEVGDVVGGALAAQAGLRDGDVLLALAGAPVTSIAELALVLRGPVAAGQPTEVTYLRGAEVRTGTGTA